MIEGEREGGREGGSKRELGREREGGRECIEVGILAPDIQ